MIGTNDVIDTFNTSKRLGYPIGGLREVPNCLVDFLVLGHRNLIK